MDDLEVFVLVAVPAQLRERRLQHPVHRGLTAPGWAHQHRAEAHVERLVHLHDFEHELVHVLQVVLLQALDDRARQVALLHLGDLHPGEQVRDDRLEELGVLAEELGQVGVAHRADQHHLLVQVRRAALERASHHEHGLQRAHAEVVVVLLRELLGGELVQLDHLARQVFRGLEALGEEHHLGDERVVGDHHGHRPEQRLEVVGQLRAPRVAGVHGDEHRERMHELHLAALEDELRDPTFHGVLNRQELLRHHREHLDVDAVELVEARPRAALRQTGEELAHELVIQVIAAVEHHALHAQRLPEVFRGLRLAGARRARGRAAELQVHRAGEGHVAPVRHGRHHQPGLRAEVLVRVLEIRVGLAHRAHVVVVVPVVPQLHLPLEVVGARGARVVKLLHDVARVHVDGDERGDDLAV